MNSILKRLLIERLPNWKKNCSSKPSIKRNLLEFQKFSQICKTQTTPAKLIKTPTTNFETNNQPSQIEEQLKLDNKKLKEQLDLKDRELERI